MGFAARTAGEPLMNLQVLVLVSTLAECFLPHYNANKFFKELAPPKGGGSKVPRFHLMTAGGFGIAAVLAGLIMSSGFLTFGQAAKGLILNNYAMSDTGALLARLGLG